MADDGFTFAGEAVDEDTNAALVVGVGTLKVRDLGANHRFQL